MNYFETKRILSTLDNTDKNKYYVYMLCDKSNGNNIPFYIGKGYGSRLWQHEEILKKTNLSLEESSEIQIEHNLEKLGLEEFEEFKKEPTTKEERINFKKSIELKNQKIIELKDNIEIVIIKWGLSEYEASMVQSSLINMYKFINGEDSITNIVNGHKSQAELLNEAKYTKARTLQEFLDDCALARVPITDIDFPILMIDISNYKYDSNYSKEDFIYNCTRSSIKIYSKYTRYIQYVFALSHSKIVGIYKVDKDSWIRMYEVLDKGYRLPPHENIDNTKYCSYYKNCYNNGKTYRGCYGNKATNCQYQECRKWGNKYCFVKSNEKLPDDVAILKNSILDFPRNRYLNDMYNFKIEKDNEGNDIIIIKSEDDYSDIPEKKKRIIDDMYQQSLF